MTNCILSEVEAIQGVTWDTARIPACDFCLETVLDDQRGAERRFHELLGEDGLVICERCLPKLFAGELE